MQQRPFNENEDYQRVLGHGFLFAIRLKKNKHFFGLINASPKIVVLDVLNISCASLFML